MRKIIVCLFLPLYAFSQKDTAVYAKKFNISSGFYLSVPQKRTEYAYRPDIGYEPNTGGVYVIHHVTKDVFQSSTLGNSLNFYLHTNFKLSKKLYFETGIDAILSFEKNAAFGDSLYLTNGLWGYASLSNVAVCNFSIPIGIQYRFTKKIISSAGFAANFCSLTSEHITDVQEKQNHDGGIEYKSKVNAFKGMFFPMFYISTDINVFQRTFLCLKVSNISISETDSRVWYYNTNTLCYSIGVKAFLY